MSEKELYSFFSLVQGAGFLLAGLKTYFYGGALKLVNEIILCVKYFSLKTKENLTKCIEENHN